MATEGLENLFADGPMGGCLFPPLPDDLDDLLPDELMQFLQNNEDGSAPAPAPVPVAEAPVCAPAPLPVPAVSTETTSSCQSEGATSSPASSPALPALPMALNPFAALQGVPAPGGVPRLVTTAAAQQVWTAMLQAAAAATSPAAAPFAAAALAKLPQVHVPQQDAKARSQQPVGPSRQGSHNCSEDSSDSDVDMEESRGKGSGGKRKAPEVDWRSIEDPSERRRQRRLAKNRVTAARSRERKKMMWSELEEKLKHMENENSSLKAMLETFARENQALKATLLNTMVASGAPAMSGQARNTSRATLAAVLIAILLVALPLSLSPGDDKAVACLASVLVPALMASALLGSADGRAGSTAALDCLFRALHSVGSILGAAGGRTGRRLQRSWHALMFNRQRMIGRKGLSTIASVPYADLLLRPHMEPWVKEPQEEQPLVKEEQLSLTSEASGFLPLTAAAVAVKMECAG